MFKTSPYVVTMNNLCMLSTYNVTTTTNQIGYETVNYSVKFKTSNKNEFQNPFSKFQFYFIFKDYGNVDCNTVKLLTIDNMTNLTWTTPNVIYDYVEISLVNANDNSSFNYSISSGSNSLVIYNLPFNTK